MSLFQAAEQVGRTGTDEQISKVVELVDQARKQVYLILAE
jgi:H2-forming N5,N10-methylenetetrahydromethanopterin dehydrogenase-like enzyme